MFEWLLKDARRAASNLIATYLGRAVVAVPFVIAAAFAIAAITLALVENFGAQMAYWILAVGFTIVGAIAAVIVSAREQEAEEEEEQAAAAEQSASSPLAVAENAIAPAAAALIPLLSSPTGLHLSMTTGRWLLRNVPLIVLTGLMAALMWPTGRTDDDTELPLPNTPEDAARAAADRAAAIQRRAGRVMASRDPAEHAGAGL